MVLAAFLFMRRMAADQRRRADAARRSREDEDRDDPDATARLDVPAGVEVFEVYGALFFGAASKFKDAVRAGRARRRAC